MSDTHEITYGSWIIFYLIDNVIHKVGLHPVNISFCDISSATSFLSQPTPYSQLFVVINCRSLTDNGFSGPIPASIGSLSNLYWLDLAENELEGPLPVSNGTTPGFDRLIHAKHLYVKFL